MTGIKSLLVLIVLILGKQNLAQSESILFPDKILLSPFKAYSLEPKLGFNSMLGKNEIRLDIGNSRDFYHLLKGDIEYSFGADLFTFTRLSGERDFHFPVGAVDYLFGLNSVVKKNYKDYTIGLRARLSHISAHFVDGHYDGTLGDWKNGRNPIVYSREFIELLPFYETRIVRLYGGITYLFHVVPRNIGKFMYHAGGEFSPGIFSSSTINPFVAYDVKLQNLGDMHLTHNVLLGVKVGGLYKPGVTIFLGYYNGPSIHGEYFDMIENYFSTGLNIDL